MKEGEIQSIDKTISEINAAAESVADALKGRLQAILNHFENGNASIMARKTDVAPSVILNYFPDSSKPTTPSFKVIAKILIAYPDVSAEWLLRGEGDMLLTPVLPEEEKEQIRYKAENSVLKQLLKAREEQITDLRYIVSILKQGS